MDNIIEISNVSIHFPIEKGILKKVVGVVRAVDDVSLFIPRGTTMGLVGESGSGKTTLGRAILQGYKLTTGSIFFNDDKNNLRIDNIKRKEFKYIRKNLQMIFQDPFSSLDPRKTVLDIISEPLKINFSLSKKNIESKVLDILDLVGLDKKYLKRFPHAFSGGQRQRIGIARALVMNPKFIICDEAVSALDVSVQAQILNLLKELQKKFNLTYLFIAHDLSVVEYISDMIAVMYLGEIIEIRKKNAIFQKPLHPYTEGLIRSIPLPNIYNKFIDKEILKGEIPLISKNIKGCYFHNRCSNKKDICLTKKPALEKKGDMTYVSCHFSNNLNLKGIQ